MLNCPGFSRSASCFPRPCACGRPSKETSPPSQHSLVAFHRGSGQRPVVCFALIRDDSSVDSAAAASHFEADFATA